MKVRPWLGVAALALVLAACSDSDDGAEIRSPDSSGGSASASGSGSASGSASGIAVDEVAGDTDDPLIQEAVVGYQAYVADQVDTMIADTTVFTDAVRAGDVDAAKAAYARSRQAWERIEPIAGLIEDIDGLVDSRCDPPDCEDEADDSFTGWHKLEWFLWDQGTVDGAAPFADQLDADLQTLQSELPSVELPPGVLTVGAQELIEEVAAPDGKLSGEEDRYSHTDLWDFKANVEGSEALVDLLRPALTESDPTLLGAIDEGFGTVNGLLVEVEDGQGGYVLYTEVTDEQRAAMGAALADLAEQLSQLNGALALS